MKRCKHCGRTGVRMQPVHSQWWPERIDAWKCASPRACLRRMEQVGQWTGKRVLRRTDLDGTQWEIRNRHDFAGISTNKPWYVLTMTYRDHRMSSMHATPDAAKAHADDLIASWTARTMRDYRSAR